MNIDITHKHFDKSADKESKSFLQLQSIIKSKIAKLSEFMPTHARKSASATVVINEVHKRSKGYRYKTEIVISLPDKKIIANAKGNTAEESVDKAQGRAARQIRKYKTKHSLKNRIKNRRPVRYEEVQGDQLPINSELSF